MFNDTYQPLQAKTVSGLLLMFLFLNHLECHAVMIAMELINKGLNND